MDRLLILSSGLPLIFDINEAEYAHYRVLVQYWDKDLLSIVFEDRSTFLKEARTIGNQPHGSLAYSAFLLLVVSKLFSLPMATWVLKCLSLTHSTLAILGWLLLLIKERISSFGICTFLILSICSAVVPLKISMLYWGTHDISIALLPWLILGFRGIDTASSIKIFSLGILAAVCSTIQLSLLPIVILCLIYGCYHFVLERNWTRGLILLSTFFVCWQLILTSTTLDAMNLPNPMLIGKDISFSFTEISYQPGLYWNNSDGILVTVVFLIGLSWGFVAAKKPFEYLMLCVALGGGITMYLLSNTITVLNQPPIGSMPRYQALYYSPVLVALVLIMRRSKVIVALVIGLSIWAASNHYFWFNPKRMEVWKEYDGVALYFWERQESIPLGKGILHAEKSHDFLLGYSLLQKLHSNSYWQFWWPIQFQDVPIQQKMTEHVQDNRYNLVIPEDFQNGTMAAFNLWLPSAQVKKKQEILRQIEF